MMPDVKLAMIGLGKMGGNMTRRLLQAGHEVVAYDRNADAVNAASAEGAIAATSLEEAVGKARLEGQPTVIWVMVPSGAPTQDTLVQLSSLLGSGDIVIDGGNSHFKDSVARGLMLQKTGVAFLDCGTSGGVWGLANGYCLMIGGLKAAFATCEPIFDALAQPGGLLYAGESGAGHFVKMVHNGIEYGMMQAYAEGFELLEKSKYDLDLRAVADVWMHGSVVRSWLLELLVNAFGDEPRLESIKDFVPDSGEGRWTVQTAMELEVPAPVITLSLMQRFASRQDESFAAKVNAALRNQFGGHTVYLNPAKKEGES
jgi:6-phosphogluconate dehydrogenase